VRDIVQAAGVPQGSFTNHFASKEAFGLEILDIYFDGICELIGQTLCNQALSPLDRLRAYFAAVTRTLDAEGMRSGCLLGNFSAEVSDHSEPIRVRLVGMFAATERALAECLADAVANDELPATLDCGATASLIQSALQGATLLAKAQRSRAALERLQQTLFSTVLKTAA
jgi:TetR/AcrR family transcriptional repressor of nem operon